MAFFRVRRHLITLLHGEQDSDFGVRHRRLYAFSDLDELRQHIEPENWARLSLGIEQNHPDLSLDWSDLRRQALELLQQQQPGFEERKVALLKRISKLQRTLPRPSREEDSPLLRAIGQRLGGLIRQAYELYLSVEGEDPNRRIRFLDALFPDEEAVGAKVDEGCCHYRDGRIGRGRKAFESARKMNPFDPDIDNSEGVCLLNRNKLGDAEQLFQSARKLAFEQLPDTKKSYSWYQHEIRPYLRATCNLGIVKERQGKLNEALALFKDCVARCPNDGLGARFHLAPIQQRLGNLHQAIALNEEFCRGSLVDGPDAFYDLASALFQLGQVGDALRRLLDGIRINYYIPPFLLKKKSPLSQSPYASVDSIDWALNYCQRHRDLWPDHCRAFLKGVWKDAELQKQVKEMEQLDIALQEANRDDYHAAFQRRAARRDQFIPPAMVERLFREYA